MLENQRLAQQASGHLKLAAQLIAEHATSSVPTACPLLSSRDLANYDLNRLFRAALDPAKRGDAEFEMDVGIRAVQAGLARGYGLFVPWSVLMRDFSAGDSNTGEPFIPPQKSGDVGAYLRGVSAAVAAGATVVGNLRGDFILPKITGGATAGIVAEAGSAGESTPTVDGLTLTPRAITGYVDFSRRYDIQVPQLVDVLASDLRAAVGAVLDEMALNGSGTGSEPLGVINNSDVGSLALGTDGGYLTWLDITKLEQVVDEAKGDIGAGAYVTSPKIKRGLRQFGSNGEAPVWQRSNGRDFLGGTPAWASPRVPTDLTKGASSDCSALVYGHWSEMFIGLWGAGVEFIIDRVTKADQGLVRMTVFLATDVGIRREACFAVVKDARIPAS